MRELARGKATTLMLLVTSATLASASVAQAETKQPTALAQAAPQKQFFQVKQMPLTEKLVQGYVAASDEVHQTTDSVEEDIDKLRPETVAKLDAIAKKNGLASYDQYKQIGENIGLVSSGFDEVTKTYVGREALIKLRIARVKADKKIPAVSKKERLADLNDELQFALPQLQYKGNVALISKYYDKLNTVMRGD